MSTEIKPYITEAIKVKEGATPLFDVVKAQTEAIKRVRVLPWTDHPEVVGGVRAALSALMGTSQSEKGHKENYIQLPITADNSVICMATWDDAKGLLSYAPGKMGVKIEHLFIFDRRSGMIADLKELWTNQPLFDGRKPKIISTLDSSSAWMIPTLPPIIDARLFRELPSGRDSRAIEIIHELGHFWQMNTEYDPPVTSYADAMEEITTGRSREIDGKSHVKYKTERVKMERNAHAFLLNLFRHLKHEGIDASESFPDMRRAIHEALVDYDRQPALRRIGSPFFEKGRRGRK